MKYRARFTPIAIGLCLSGMVSLPVYAAAEAGSSLDTLQAQVTELQREVKTLKAHARKHYYVKRKAKTSTKHHSADALKSAEDGEYVDHPVQLTGREIIKMIREEQEFLPFDLDVPGQAFVSTGPYVGVPIQYSGSNLIVNSPYVNTDVQLLSIRKSIHKELEAMGGEIFKEPYHSHLLLSGAVSGLVNYFNPGGQPSRTDINVTNVALNAFFLGPSDWLLGFADFMYDSSSPINSVYTSTNNYRTSNSRLFVNRAFATVGDLSKTPFYGTFGQFFVPFGTYSSVLISDPFTKALGRTKARAIEIGMQQQTDNSFYASAYIFKGDSHAASVSKVNNGGINAGYKYKFADTYNINWGGGLIANLADSGGMQLGNGFSSYEQITHRVPGYNLRGLFGLGKKIDIIAEFVGSTTSFNPNDMSFNGRGAKPWALDTQIAYTFTIFDERPSSVALVYDKSYQALALGIPSQRYALVMTTSLLRNTLQGIEFRRDRNYAASDTANGPTGAATTTGACTAASCSGNGKLDTAVTATFDYYF